MHLNIFVNENIYRFREPDVAEGMSRSQKVSER